MSSPSSADAALQARARRHEAAADLGQRALDADDLAELFDEAVDALAATLETEYAAVFELLPDRDAAVLARGAGWAEGLGGTAVIATEPETVPGRALQSGDPVLVPDLEADERFSRSGLLSSHDVESALVVAVGPPAEPWGVLGTYSTEHREFTAQDVEFLQRVANVLGSAIENAATLEQFRAERETDRAEREDDPVEQADDRAGQESDREREGERAEEDDERAEPDDVRADQTLHERVVQTSPVGIVVVDVDGELQYANDRAESILGRSESDLEWFTRASDEREVVDADGAPLSADELPLERIVAEHEPVEDLELGLSRPDGDRVWLSVDGTPLWADEDAVRGAVFAFEDVTERRRRDRELERFETLFTESKDVNAVLDPDGTFQYVPPSVEHVLGYEQSELLEADPFEYVHPDDRERVQSEFAQLVAEPEYEPSIEYRFRHADGSWVVLETRGRNLLDDPVVGGIVVYTRDVTERTERERELEARSAAMERSVDGMAILDADQEYVFVNQAHAGIYGYDDPEAFLGESWRRCYDDEEIERLEAEAVPELEETGSWRGEAVGRCADGDTFQQELSLTRLEDGRFVCVVRDVSERKQRERELERYEQIVENLPVGVYRNTPGPEGELVEANATLASIFDADSVEELLEHSVSDLYTDPRERAAFSRTLEREGSVRNVELQQETLEGDSIWISVTGIRTEEDGETYFDGVVQDITEQRERRRQIERQEAALRETYDVIADGERSFEEKVRDLLDIGREQLGTDYATLADVEGDQYCFEIVSGTDDVDAGDVIPLEETNCERAIATDETLVLEDIAADAPDLAQRAGNVRWDLSTYVGSPVYAEDELTGILCFFGEEPRSEPFSDWEVTMVELWSQWISYELDRTQYRQQLEQYRSLTEAANDVIVTIDGDSQIQNVNPAAEDVFGYEPEELVGESLTVLMGEDMAIQHREALTHYLETGERTLDWDYVEVPGKHADGHAVPLSITFSEVEYGGETYFTGVVRDVTDRERREQLLEERERQLSNLIDNVPGMVYRCRNERDWPMEFVSDVAAELTGYEPEAFERGEVSWGEDVIATDEDRELLWDTVQAEASDGEGTFSATYRIRTADGEQRWVRDYGRGVYDEDGDLVEIEGIVSDVTDRKRLESELDEVFGRVTDAFFALDENWEFTYVNEKADRIINPDGRELEGENFWETFPHAEGSRFQEEYERAMYEQETVSFEAYYPEPLDTWFEVNAYPSETGLSVYFRDVTERREREEELRQKERRYEATFQDPNILVGLLDPDGTVLDINETAMEYVDAELADVTGEPFWETPWWGGDDVVDDVREWTERAADGEYVDFETDLTSPDGERYTLSGYFRPVTNDDGEVESIIVSDRDITERKRRERELEESERRYRTLVEHFPNGAVALVDEDLRYQTVGGDPMGPASATVDEVEGSPVAEALPDALAAELVPRYEAALESGEADSFVFDRGERVFQFQVVPVRDEEGDIFGALGMSQDVTERTEYERYLADAKSQLEAATEAGAVGTWEWEVQSDRMVTGETFARTFGIDPERARDGVSIDEFFDAIHEEDRDRVEAEVGEVLESGGEYETEYRVRNADGDVRWVVARGRVETDEDGTPVSFPGAVTDVTERKRTELELERSKNQLESIFESVPVGVVVAERDGELVEANDTAREIWGDDVFDADSVEGYDRFDAVWEDSGEPVAPEEWTMSRVLEGEAVTDPDVFEIETADGERRVILAQGRPVRDAGGRVQRGVVTFSDITQRREYQRQVEENERRYRAIVENFPNGAVGMFDEDLEYVTAGGSVLEDVDVDPDDVVGTDLWERYPEAMAEELEPKFRAALAGESNAFEKEFHGRHWLWYTAPIGGGDGDGPAGLVMTQDITDRKQMEEELRESEAKFRMLAENLEQIVWMSDAETQETYYVNPAFEDVWGASRDVLYDESNSILQAVHPEDRDRVEAIFTDTETLEYDLEYRLVRPDGDVRWLHTRTVAIEDEDGEADRIVGIADDVTERKERERKLEESERRYRTLVENFPDGAVGMFDENLEYTAIGGEILEEDGRDPDELTGSSVYDLYPDDVVAEVEPHFQSALEGEASTIEIEYQGRHLAAYTLPVRNAREEVFAGMLVAQDVTEQREKERQLREREQRLERYKEYTDDVLDAIDDVFYIVGEDGTLQRWNESVNEVTGYSDSEIAEMSPMDFFDESDRERAAETIAAGFEDGHAQLEAEFLTTDGERIPFEFVGSTLEDPSGQRVLAGIGRDISERREHRRQLEESERRYRTLAEHFPNGAVGVYDHDLRYTLAEGAMLGDGLPTAEHLEGQRMPDVFPEDTIADLEPLFRAAIEDGEVGSTQTTFGGRHWKVWAAPLRDADGEIFAGLSLAQDVTEQIEREERLEELVEQLEASNERLEQFAYAASHDLQEPLRMVSSYLTLIERRYADRLDEDGQEFIDYAVDGADRMRDMIEALLEYSRVETRGDPFEPVDLEAVVEDARQDLGMRIDESDAEITVEELPTVEGDPDQLGQVFQNLLKNGIDYSGDESPEIHVSAERRGEEWLVSVRDEGIGIDPDQAERVFQVFQRLHSHDEHPGTGIGLALTRRIVERHGGEIWVDSAPGEGSTFSFTLPERGTDNE